MAKFEDFDFEQDSHTNDKEWERLKNWFNSLDEESQQVANRLYAVGYNKGFDHGFLL